MIKNDEITAQPDEITAQPYVQLSKILRKHGRLSFADEILFLAKKIELTNSKSYIDKMWLFLQYIFVGFGYRYKWTLSWFVILIFVGTAFAIFIPNTDMPVPMHTKILDALFFSIDKTTPYLELNTHIDDIPDILQYYYYLQRIVGILLSLFLVAALTGITKRFDE